MTCKDCIHEEMCGTFTRPYYPDEADASERLCNNFKNKADFVEVVRCHECKHYKIQEKSRHWQNKKKYCCRSAILKVNDFDFCSYGERGDT